MSDIQELQQKLADLEASLAQVKEAIEVATEKKEFEQIKEVLFSDKWPVAANKNLICNPENEADKVERGRGVFELMVETDIAGKKFLDFGCGEGHSAAYAATRNPELVVGYDIKNGWEKLAPVDKLMLTTNWDEVVKNGPYDVILVYDVIDHLVDKKPLEVMKDLHAILADKGNLYLRAHPFTSRHALHNYHDLNKGYIQLVLSEDELKQVLPSTKYIEWNNAKVVTPIATYKKLFEDAGFEIMNTRPVRDTVDPFFKTPLISKRIIDTVKFKDFPEFQCGIQFLDQNLRKSI
jgi:SAM-dependent methyltransferase